MEWLRQTTLNFDRLEVFAQLFCLPVAKITQWRVVLALAHFIPCIWTDIVIKPITMSDDENSLCPSRLAAAEVRHFQP